MPTPLLTSPDSSQPTSCSSAPSSLLRLPFLDNIQMCNASVTRSSLCLLAQSTIQASFHSAEWSCVQACSAMANFSNCLWLQVLLCSFSLLSSHWIVFLVYTHPHVKGTWYTTMNCFPNGSGSFTLVSSEQMVLTVLKVTFMPKLLHTLLITLRTPSLQRILIVLLGTQSCSLGSYFLTETIQC